MGTRLIRIDKWGEMRLKSDAEYVKTVNGIELWKAPAGYRLFKRKGKDMLFAGAFSPLSYAEELANNENA